MRGRLAAASLVAVALFTAGGLAALADTTPPVTTTDAVTTADAPTTTDAATTTTTTTTTAAAPTPAPTTTAAAPTPPVTTTTAYDPWAAWLAAIAAYRAAHAHPSQPPQGGGGGSAAPPAAPPPPPPPPPPPAHLVVSGSATPASGATVGSTVALSYTVTNTGGQPVAATFTDALPSQVTLIEADSDAAACSGTQELSCPLGTIAAGAAVTVTVAVQVVDAAAFADAPAVTAADPGVAVDAPRAQSGTATRAFPVQFGRAVSRAR